MFTPFRIVSVAKHGNWASINISEEAGLVLAQGVSVGQAWLMTVGVTLGCRSPGHRPHPGRHPRCLHR